jgi:hypothetical protein
MMPKAFILSRQCGLNKNRPTLMETHRLKKLFIRHTL